MLAVMLTRACARTLLELRDDARDGSGELQRLGLELDPSALQAGALQDLRDHELHARQIGQHALDEHARLLGRRGAQRQRLQRQLQACERGLELVTHEREKAVLFLEHVRLGAQRAGDHRDAKAERQEKEGTLPGVLAARGCAALASSAVLTSGAMRARPSATTIFGSSCVTRGGLVPASSSACAAAACSAYAPRVAATRGGGESALIEQPPADLHHRHQHQREGRQLKDARRFHARAVKDSRRACAKRSRSARVCASDKKHASYADGGR